MITRSLILISPIHQYIYIASSSRDISTFMIKENTPEDILVCAAELKTAYKVVNHHQSFNSLDFYECPSQYLNFYGNPKVGAYHNIIIYLLLLH